MSSPAATSELYSPVERLETRTHRVAELVITSVAVAGVAVAGGRLGVVAGVALLACWLYLRAEVTFVVGAVLVAGIGGAPSTPGTILAAVGLAGLLALELARAWGSARPVGAFLASLVVGVVAFVAAGEFVALRWVGGAAAAGLVGAVYGLTRIERRVAGRRGSGAEAAGAGQPEQEGAER